VVVVRSLRIAMGRMRNPFIYDIEKPHESGAFYLNLQDHLTISFVTDIYSRRIPFRKK
jgi:hypothetical protein